MRPEPLSDGLQAWAFESVHAFGEGSYVVFVGYGLVAVAVAIMDFRLPSLLAENPRLVRTLNQSKLLEMRGGGQE
jgi:hypothetical protein